MLASQTQANKESSLLEKDTMDKHAAEIHQQENIKSVHTLCALFLTCTLISHCI